MSALSPLSGGKAEVQLKVSFLTRCGPRSLNRVVILASPSEPFGGIVIVRPFLTTQHSRRLQSYSLRVLM
jgi:hypothetical protein